MSLSIVHVVRQYTPSVGGMENVVANIVRQQLAGQGHRPSIVTLDRVFGKPAQPLKREEEIDGVRVRRLQFTGSRRYPLCPAVLGEVAQADLVHVHGIDFFFDYLALTRPVHRKPLVVSTHGGFFHTRFFSPLKKLYFNTVSRTSCRAYARVVATSDNDGSIFERIVSRPRLQVIENGVDIERYRDCAARRLRPVLLYFGRWSGNKGLPDAIRLFQQLHAANPAWQFIIAGREFDLTAADLTAHCANAGAAATAIRIVAAPSDAELKTLMGEASFFIGLSSHEGFGLAAIEAMSAGLIPVLSTIPPFRKIVEGSATGMLVGAEPTDAVRRLQRLLSDGQGGYEDSQRRMGSFVRRYAWNTVASAYERSYEQTLRG